MKEACGLCGGLIGEEGAVDDVGEAAAEQPGARFDREPGESAVEPGGVGALQVLPVASSRKAHARLAQHPRAEVDHV